MKKILMFLVLISLMTRTSTLASDHDDGEMERKGRSLNITDVYVFREDNQTGRPQDAGNLILIMNTNPRSLPSQQYFFSSQARYSFNLTRVLGTDVAKRPSGSNDVSLTFTFSEPDAQSRQAMTLLFNDGSKVSVDKTNNGVPIFTTPISSSKAGNLTLNELTVNGKPVTVFAGLREDSFFFDVEQFFKVRAKAVETYVANGGKNPQFIGFLPGNQAKDFTHNYNVNPIVVRVPITLLQKNTNETVFDVWTTIALPK